MHNQFGIAAPRVWARVAGVCWLLTIAGGVFAERMVRSELIVDGDVTATLHNISLNEGMYRFAIAAEFAGTATYLALTAILYLLLAPVSRPLSLMACVFSVAGCTIWFSNLVNNSAPLLLLGGSPAPTGAELLSMQVTAFAFVRMGNEALLAGMLCFGVHCLLLGGLLARSKFFAWPVGAVLALGGIGYLVIGFAHVAAPGLAVLIGKYASLPGPVGELLAGVWLTVFGVDSSRWTERAARTD